jgi:ankyrin repeat protein
MHLFIKYSPAGALVSHCHSTTGMTALMAAAGHNQDDTCAHLLRLGADRAAVAANGWTALEFARQLNAGKALSVLKEWGSDAIADTVLVVCREPGQVWAVFTIIIIIINNNNAWAYFPDSQP